MKIIQKYLEAYNEIEKPIENYQNWPKYLT